jgi:hypothetical protein
MTALAVGGKHTRLAARYVRAAQAFWLTHFYYVTKILGTGAVGP